MPLRSDLDRAVWEGEGSSFSPGLREKGGNMTSRQKEGTRERQRQRGGDRERPANTSLNLWVLKPSGFFPSATVESGSNLKVKKPSYSFCNPLMSSGFKRGAKVDLICYSADFL